MAKGDYDYRARRALNDRSRSWARKQHDRWEPYDSAYIVDQWVFKTRASRDEEAVSRHLERTIESCRMHAEYLRKELGISAETHSSGKTAAPPVETCAGCWTVPSASGQCLCEPD